MICNYWMRTLMLDYNASFEFFMNAVLGYYCSRRFEWDPERMHSMYILREDGKTFVCKYSWGARSICSKNLLSADSASIVRWEMTLKERGGGSHLRMGYIDGDHIEDFEDDEMIAKSKHGLALSVVDTLRPEVIQNDKISKRLQDWRFHTNSGDRIKLEFDFKTRQCNAFYNDELLGLMTSNLPKQIYLAASAWMPLVSYETTLFETL